MQDLKTRVEQLESELKREKHLAYVAAKIAITDRDKWTIADQMIIDGLIKTGESNE